MPEPGISRRGAGGKSTSWDLRQRLELFEDLAGEWNKAWETSKELEVRYKLVFGDEFIPRPKDLAPPVGLIYRDVTPSVLAILAADR